MRYIVAPYEADPQMAYLEREGLVDAIMTEDSDLLVYGCQTMLSKYNATRGTVVSVSRAHFGFCDVIPQESIITISLQDWTDAQLREMAILAGCDYGPKIRDVGLKTAYDTVASLKPWKEIKELRSRGKIIPIPNPDSYLKNFSLAEKVFLHQRVYDPRQEKLVYFTEVDPSNTLNEEEETCVGQ